MAYDMKQSIHFTYILQFADSFSRRNVNRIAFMCFLFIEHEYAEDKVERAEKYYQ